MNEFQAILVEIIFFAGRFAVPVLIIYLVARLIHHFDQVEEEIETHEPKPSV
ncbi:MAG: hypothetical protein KIS95_08800 [Anaerolineae bacterium]|uniref:hypothetical protein n=1 Tax=Promineifilum sp. TaxID=2664178 RepID=UPI001D77E49C|nr:hypothetical protein [Anaerolineales bacterium]MCB8934352.1 hypothetical protein [Promineifilum sp.]MCO5180321.1 hypothetical protein [Promineifilum sp.]MCW5847313.1 hypothetical protein [Anaerolineae bacterium]